LTGEKNAFTVIGFYIIIKITFDFT